MEKPNWNILQLTEQKEAFVQQVILETKASLEAGMKKPISYKSYLEKVVYKERTRINKNPWRVDPKNESKVWSGYKSRLAKMYSSDLEPEQLLEREKELASEIIDSYAREVVGYFSVRTFRFAIKAVPLFLSRILNGVSGKWFFGIFQKKRSIKEKIKFHGDLELIRSLEKQGTIVLVPTHSSNFDSMLIGYAAVLMGLPPFLYGAGLNLFNNRIVGFFIERLGAYKLDRRKKNVFYLETLKVFSRVALQRGVHTLFYPGGTRSRTGAIEDKVKLGLLNTVVEAQRNNYLKKDGQKIFIVPLVTSYHFVLEAPGLIKQHLKSEAKEKLYMEREQFGGFFKSVKFLWKFISKGSDIVLSYGEPMDVFGYKVNDKGESMDERGRKVDVSKYFVSKGELSIDKQRDSEYTQFLGDKIVEAFKKEQIVLSTQVVAFVAFRMIKKKFKDFDMYNTLKLNDEDTAISFNLFEDRVQQFVHVLKKISEKGELKIDEMLQGRIDLLIEEGLKNIGLYHAKKVLYKDKQGKINTQDMALLYFYHNRLTGYGLEQYV